MHISQIVSSRASSVLALTLVATVATISAACTVSDGGIRARRGAAAPAAAVRPTASEETAGVTASNAHGRELFQHSWTARDPKSRGGDGLGPNFNGSSCSGCHNQGGAGGAGGAHGNTFIFNGTMMPKTSDDSFNRAMTHQAPQKLMTVIDSNGAFAEGGLARHRAVSDLLEMTRPAVQECLGDVKLEGSERTGRFKRFEVRFDVDAKGVASSDVSNAPQAKRASAAERAAPLKASMLACLGKVVHDVKMPSTGAASTITWHLFANEVMGPIQTSGMRNPTALFGAGVLDTIADKDIVANVRAIEGHPEISGVVPRTEKGEVARFGWKGDVKDLDTFVERACALEVGLEVPGMHQYGFDDVNAVGLDLNKDDVHDLTRFVRALPRPTKVAATKETQRGARLFENVGCTACHVERVGNVDAIYSDLLLHDMGAHLADGGGYGGGLVAAKDREWRTPPLWGARDSGPWMHDGRAATLKDAISSHGGEAAVVRDTFDALREDDQRAVVAFLESLQATDL